MKSAPFYLLLTLLAAPAMADNLFSGIIDFGRDLLDETRKLAPGIQNDKRNEAPSPVAATAPDDGRDRPALENSAHSQNTVIVAPSSTGMPPPSPAENHGWQFVEEDHLNGSNQ
ncbi:hypothetical protein HNR62_001000 [Oceanisphaera litoralis]|uniref:hypothetical protein n=1 Tax=Oceanisphaera litoralis TaxID=225144 RepID=UPI00195E541E|nr:hypothetical protein [Oceanisphaera litoralis]MBM7455140.1 hypothetical protein [Oceanisphaera litoralis]